MMRNLLATLGRRTEPSRAALRSGPDAARETIVIIDDHPEDLRAMCLALAGESYRLETAGTAEAAIRKVSGCQPDLILVDWQVPATDGTRLTRRLLADEALIPVPIVVLTEMAAGLPVDSAARGRYDGNIAKPIHASDLPGQVRAILESSRQAPSHYHADLLPPLNPAADRRQQATNLLEAIEAGLPDSQFVSNARTGLHRLAEVLRGLQNDELADYLRQAERLSNASTVRARSRFRSVIRLCRELIQRDPDEAPGFAGLRAGYLDHRRTELGGLDHSLRNGDFAALRKAGHNLKGTGAAYGFCELTDIGRALEAAAKDDNPAAVEMLLDQIEAYIGIVRPVKKDRGDHATGI
jgi:CheY-like chemotaxis protein